MSTDIQAAREDLAFLRGLVDDDPGTGQWLFGTIYVAVGVAICLHLLFSYLLKPPFFAIALLALYGTISVLVPWLLWRPLTHIGGEIKSVRGRAGAAVFLSALVAHVVMLAVFVIVAWRLQTWELVGLATTVLFVTQGVVWSVVHALGPRKWTFLETAGWFLGALALGTVIMTDAFAPLLAVLLLLLMIVPGIHMMRAGGEAR